MKKAMSKLLALVLMASMVLTGCSSGNETTDNSAQSTTGTQEQGEESAESEDAITNLYVPKLASRELETFNVLYTQRAEDGENLTNLVDGLLESDTNGELVPCLAEEWGTEDGGKNWTFKLREGVKWVDVNGNEKADVVSQDFATGLEWILNFYKNDSNNTTMPIEMISGAGEYYEYTKALPEEEAKALDASEGSKFREMVGIETPDDYTIIYHCITEKPYFDSLAAYAALYPMAQGMVDEIGSVDAVQAMNNENMWYNGCYTMTSYIQGNEKVFTKNPLYWDTECSRFDTVTFRMVESNDVAFHLYQTNEVDYVELTESQLVTIARDENNEYHDYLIPDLPSHYAYNILFNYDKKLEDGSPDTDWNYAIANENFRKSWWYGLDLSEYYKRYNAIDPMSSENNFYTMKGLVYTSDGTDYTELVRQELGLPELNGEKMVRLDEEKAQQCKEQAIEELTALGVTFPIGVDYYILGSNQTALDTANVLAQAIADGLGEDYAQLNIKTYVSSQRNEVTTPQLQSIIINGWGADYADPQNYLSQIVYGTETAAYSDSATNINDVVESEQTQDLLDSFREFTDMVATADAITDNLDDRYQAYAEAEAYMLDHVLVLPCYYKSSWCLSRIDVNSKMQPMFGNTGDKMKNWKTNINGYTSEEKGVSEQIAAFAAE